MDKLYIIGVRYNPQLGSYLSKVIVANAKVNKTCISAKFEDYGSTVSLRFSTTPNVDGRHVCLTRQNCVYGGYDYYGFSDKDKAIAELQKWTTQTKSVGSAARAKIGIELIKAA